MVESHKSPNFTNKETTSQNSGMAKLHRYWNLALGFWPSDFQFRDPHRHGIRRHLPTHRKAWTWVVVILPTCATESQNCLRSLLKCRSEISPRPPLEKRDKEKRVTGVPLWGQSVLSASSKLQHVPSSTWVSILVLHLPFVLWLWCSK